MTEGRNFLSMPTDQSFDHGQYIAPYFIQIMLDPTRLWIDLRMLFRLAIQALATHVKKQRFGRRGALVNGKYVFHIWFNILSAVFVRPSIEIP